MGLGEVKAAIASQTQKEADAIVNQAKEESKKILSQAQAEVSSKKQQHDATTAAMLDAMARKEHAAAAFARKTMLLEQKSKALSQAVEQVRNELANLSATERAKVLEKLAAKAKAEISVQKVQCASQDVAYVSKLFPQASIMADKATIGGLRATNAEGTVTIDYSFETLLEATRESELESLSKELFG